MGLLLPLPILARLVRPVGTGRFPLAIMNDGISFDQQQGRTDPPVGFRDAAHWFARRGYAVITPIGPTSGLGAIDLPERELYKIYFSFLENCDDPYSLRGSAARATANKWIIDYMTRQRLIIPDNVIVVGQSPGGWAAIALSSLNPTSIRAIITFAAGREGASMANPKIVARPKSSLKRRVNLVGRRAFPCFGYTPRTITILDPNYPGRCTRHSPGPAA